jgi:hypothetical protein
MHDTRYYLLWVGENQEDAFIAAFTKCGLDKLDHRDRLDHREGAAITLLCPKKIGTNRKEGRVFDVVQPVFKGYVIAEVPADCAPPQDALPLNAAETSLVQRFLDVGDTPLGKSVGYFDSDGKLVVTDGPLMGLEQYVTAVDRRRGKAKLELPLAGRSLAVYMECEITSGVRIPIAIKDAGLELAGTVDYLSDYEAELLARGMFASPQWRALEQGILRCLAARGGAGAGNEIERILSAFEGFVNSYDVWEADRRRLGDCFLYSTDRMSIRLYTYMGVAEGSAMSEEEFLKKWVERKQPFVIAARFLRYLCEQRYLDTGPLIWQEDAQYLNAMRGWRRYTLFWPQEAKELAFVYGKIFEPTERMNTLRAPGKVAIPLRRPVRKVRVARRKLVSG